jgi:hypothetical protein
VQRIHLHLKFHIDVEDTTSPMDGRENFEIISVADLHERSTLMNNHLRPVAAGGLPPLDRRPTASTCH